MGRVPRIRRFHRAIRCFRPTSAHVRPAAPIEDHGTSLIPSSEYRSGVVAAGGLRLEASPELSVVRNFVVQPAVWNTDSVP